MRCINTMNNTVYENSVHNGLPLNFEQSAPTPTPLPSLCSMTAAQNVAGGGLWGRARGDLAASCVESVWLVTGRQVPEICNGSIDRPGEQRASPSPSILPSPTAADATWRPQSLQPARRRRRAPAGSPEPMSMSRSEKAFSAGRQAACRPLLSPFLGGRV